MLARPRDPITASDDAAILVSAKKIDISGALQDSVCRLGKDLRYWLLRWMSLRTLFTRFSRASTRRRLFLYVLPPSGEAEIVPTHFF